jgi:2-keto-3-deoxy-6-phosphogluconate aldolase
VSARAARLGLPLIPGVASATDIQTARRSGHRWMKAFPASVLGPDWIRAQRGPFPDVSFVATGGIDADNAAEFLDAGARVVALGASLARPDVIDRIAPLLARPDSAP